MKSSKVQLCVFILILISLSVAQMKQESHQSIGNVQCIVQEVRNGEVIYHGNHTKMTAFVGETIEIKCFGGFRLANVRSGITRLTCQEDGSWKDSLLTPVIPVCDRIGGCSMPKVMHGQALPKSEGTYMPGETSFIICDAGYAIAESKQSYIVCQHDGTWKGDMNGPPPHCEVQQCEQPIQIAHGSYKMFTLNDQLDNNVYLSGTRLYYFCDSGYVLRDESVMVVTCQASVWQGADQLQCIAKGEMKTCLHPSSFVNGYYTLSYKDDATDKTYNDQFIEGTVATFSCNMGYKLIGETKRICKEGKWMPVMQPLCIPVAKGCSQPPKIAFGNYSLSPDYSHYQDKLPESAVAYYSCKTGYKIETDEKIAQLTCKDTQWRGIVPSCVKRINCDKPMDIPNGNWIFLDLYTDFRIGLRVSYECNEGYRLIGASEIICEESGYWSDNAPKCLLRDKYCSDPGSIANGFYVCKSSNCDSFRVGTEVHYLCSKGYDVQPDEFRVQTCDEGGHWSGQTPVCSAVTSSQIQQIKFFSEPSTLVVLVVTSCGILGLLLLVMIIVTVQRRMKQRMPMPFCPSDPDRPSLPPFMPSMTSQAGVRREHDRVALIAFPDVDSSAVLPTYEEAIRNRTPVPRIARFGSELGHSSSIRSIRSDYRLLPHVAPCSVSRIGTPGVQMREHASDHRNDHHRNSIVTTASTTTRDNISLAFGSVETVNVSDATSTTVTIGTYESSGSNPSLAASQRATAGSVTSASPTEEDVPLLEGNGGTIGRTTRQQIDSLPIPEEEHQD